MRTSVVVLACASAMLCASAVQSQQQISADDAGEIARDAYVYAYPLLLHDVSIRQTTNFAEPTGIPGQGPFNQFSHAKAFPPADFKIVVRPNADTLYSVASLDLGTEPLVLSVPATDRYFMLPMLSLWTDVFAVPGTRTTGRSTAREFLVSGPNWQGRVPDGLEVIRSPTRFVTIIGRTQTNGVADYENVHKIQAGYKLTPRSAWGKRDYARLDPAFGEALRLNSLSKARSDSDDSTGAFCSLAATTHRPGGGKRNPRTHAAANSLTVLRGFNGILKAQ